MAHPVGVDWGKISDQIMPSTDPKRRRDAADAVGKGTRRGLPGSLRRFLIAVGAALGARQTALLLVMPFISLYGRSLEGQTPTLVGLALGIYGLSQAALQIPFGRWSDRFGRKPLLLVGLAITGVGFLLAGWASHILTFIGARALQGAGAIFAVSYAWIGDNAPEEFRNRAIGFVSSMVGAAAVVAFVVGPLLYSVLPMPTIFYGCGILTFALWLWVALTLEEAPRVETAAAEGGSLWRYLLDRDLLRLTAAAFLMNFAMVSVFYIAPRRIDAVLGGDRMWMVFAPATLAGILAVRPLSAMADGGRYLLAVYLTFAALVASLPCLFSPSGWVLGLGMALFMVGYIGLVTLLPGGVTRLSDERTRGAVMGVFHTLQFVGTFVGATATGALWGADPRLAAGVVAVGCIAGAWSVSGLSRAATGPAARTED